MSDTVYKYSYQTYKSKHQFKSASAEYVPWTAEKDFIQLYSWQDVLGELLFSLQYLNINILYWYIFY